MAGCESLPTANRRGNGMREDEQILLNARDEEVARRLRQGSRRKSDYLLAVVSEIHRELELLQKHVAQQSALLTITPGRSDEVAPRRIEGGWTLGWA